jgi:membrane protein YdbS with pleckstrin-like domain
MDYQITCVCGHTFLVSDRQIEAGPVTCPVCKQKLTPVVEKPAEGGHAPTTHAPGVALPAGPSTAEEGKTGEGTGEAVPRAADATKRCPFCGEVILAIARKCKHCGEFLDRTPPGGFPPPTQSGANAPGSTATAPAGGVAGADVPPVYTLSVSQWDNFWKYLILLILVTLVAAALILIPTLKEYAVVGTMGACVIAAFFGWFFYLAARHTRCLIRPTRIDTEEGILSKELNTLELFRITDMELKQGLFERVLGIGTIKLMTADDSNPELVLYQIPRAREVYKYIQNQIPVAAKQRGAVYMES